MRLNEFKLKRYIFKKSLNQLAMFSLPINCLFFLLLIHMGSCLKEVNSDNRSDTSEIDNKSEDSDFDDFSLEDGELSQRDSSKNIFENKSVSAMIQSLPDRNGGFYCTVSIHAGIADTEHHVDLLNYFCKKISPTTTMASTHQLIGDVKEFFGDKEINRSVLYVPDQAVELNGDILLDKGVEKIAAEVERIALPTKAKLRLLIINIADGRQGEGFPYKLAVNFFGKRNRNIRNIYNNCSAKKLKIRPAIYGV